MQSAAAKCVDSRRRARPSDVGTRPRRLCTLRAAWRNQLSRTSVAFSLLSSRRSFMSLAICGIVMCMK